MRFNCDLMMRNADNKKYLLTNSCYHSKCTHKGRGPFIGSHFFLVLRYREPREQKEACEEALSKDSGVSQLNRYLLSDFFVHCLSKILIKVTLQVYRLVKVDCHKIIPVGENMSVILTTPYPNSAT